MSRQLIFVCLLFCAATMVNAQLRKCVGSDGKITYSDVLCATGTKSESGVHISENTLDASGDRAAATNYKEKAAVENAVLQDGGQCKFSYYTLSDENGKRLAEAAKRECLENIAARALGKPTSNEAYRRYTDNKIVNKRTVCSGSAVTTGTVTTRTTGGNTTGTVNGITTGSTVCR